MPPSAASRSASADPTIGDCRERCRRRRRLRQRACARRSRLETAAGESTLSEVARSRSRRPAGRRHRGRRVFPAAQSEAGTMSRAPFRLAPVAVGAGGAGGGRRLPPMRPVPSASPRPIRPAAPASAGRSVRSSCRSPTIRASSTGGLTQALTEHQGERLGGVAAAGPELRLWRLPCRRPRPRQGGDQRLHDLLRRDGEDAASRSPSWPPSSRR